MFVTSEQVMFDELLHSLKSEKIVNISLELMDLSENPYDQIKASLSEKYEMSEKERLNKLFEIKLGDSKPTEMLRKMRLMSRIKENDSEFSAGFLREMFLKQMPENVRGILVSHVGCPLEELAKMADGIQKSLAEPTSKQDPGYSAYLLLDKKMNHVMETVADFVKKSADTKYPIPIQESSNPKYGKYPQPTYQPRNNL